MAPKAPIASPTALPRKTSGTAGWAQIERPAAEPILVATQPIARSASFVPPAAGPIAFSVPLPVGPVHPVSIEDSCQPRSSCPADGVMTAVEEQVSLAPGVDAAPLADTLDEECSGPPPVPFLEGAGLLAELAEKIISLEGRQSDNESWRAMYTAFLEEYGKIAQCVESGLEACREEKGPVNADKSALVAFQLMLNCAKISKHREQVKMSLMLAGMPSNFMVQGPVPVVPVPVHYVQYVQVPVMTGIPCQFPPASPAKGQDCWTPRGNQRGGKNRRVSGFAGNRDRRGSSAPGPIGAAENRLAASPAQWKLPPGDNAPLPTPKRSNRFDIVNPETNERVVPELHRVKGKSPMPIKNPVTGENVMFFDPDRPSNTRTLSEIPEDLREETSSAAHYHADIYATPTKEQSARSAAACLQASLDDDKWILENSNGSIYGSWDFPLSRPEKKERALMIRQVELMTEIEELKIEQGKHMDSFN